MAAIKASKAVKKQDALNNLRNLICNFRTEHSFLQELIVRTLPFLLFAIQTGRCVFPAPPHLPSNTAENLFGYQIPNLCPRSSAFDSEAFSLRKLPWLKLANKLIGPRHSRFPIHGRPLSPKCIPPFLVDIIRLSHLVPRKIPCSNRGNTYSPPFPNR